MRKLLVITLLVLITLQNVFAQDKTEYQKRFEAFKKERSQEFQDYKDKQNAEFAAFLEKRWKSFQSFRGVEPPKDDILPEPVISKPEVEIPVEPVIPIPTEPIITEPIITVPIEPIKPVPIEPIIPIDTLSTIVPSVPKDGLPLDFFSETAYITWDVKKLPIMNSVSEKAFASYWKALSPITKNTVKDLDSFAKSQNLNGWGYYELVKKFSEIIYPNSQSDNRIALQVFLLSQLEFKVKAAVNGDNLCLLLPFDEQVYSVPFLVIDTQKYYIYSYNQNTKQGYRTYAKDFASANSTLSLSMDKYMSIGKDIVVELPLWSKILGQNFSTQLNKGLLDFELHYPIVGPEVYYNQLIPQSLSNQVINSLKQKTLEMTKTEAVKYILNLIQNGFEYITDDEAFGRQKQLFIEESFYYGRNNCKDRVAIFSWLVEQLTGLDVVYIYYDGTPRSGGVSHIACAVAFDEEVSGDSYIYKGKRYTICDPTYINAGIGETMSFYNPSQGQVKEYN